MGEPLWRQVFEDELACRKRYEEALREALEMAEDCMQYVSPFLIQKWGYDDDLARLKALLNDGGPRG